MIDYTELMKYFSRPRANGSSAEFQTRQAIKNWLQRYNIPFQVHTFRLLPNFFVGIGIWLILSRSLLAIAIWARWGWSATIIALIGLAGGLLDVTLGIPMVSWPGATKGENILIEFKSPNPNQEVILSAHYDSKTELLDHHQRMFFIRSLYPGIVITLLLGVLGPLDVALLAVGSNWTVITYWSGVLFSLLLLFLAWGLGLNMSLGRFRSQSQGAVDNGAACAILLGLAHQARNGELNLNQTNLTVALFGGEEVNMQGSRAYVQKRNWPLPAIAVNLEVMAQNGQYVYWEYDGTSLKLTPTSDQINNNISRSIQTVTGNPAHPSGPVNSDGYSFLRAGIPATTIGTYDLKLKDRGFHGPADNLERVVMSRLPEAVNILCDFLHNHDLNNGSS